MKKQFIALIFCLLVFIFTVSPSFASPVINEFSSNTSPDWVEIYNPDQEAVDLSMFRIRDLTASNKLDLSGNLDPGSFLVFEWSNKLNNGGDLIKLVLISDESIIDETKYGDEGGLSAPLSTQTGGRKEDGGDEWVLFRSSSKGASNNSSDVYVPPTPTNTPIPTPTNPPKPIKTPTPIKSKTIKASTGSTSTTSVNTASSFTKTPPPSPMNSP